ncbi:hypothetical protein GCM10010300_36190 [Streptomyces olivaceoviridis]|uniref:hypothetical protein n=1 Tax=Streptomyces olivaceoviridis TaxID=1921 RepID=UPI00167C0A04|nr:hypothetical protein [Streptomyces olivaceoviridis]GGY88848.1 hypothetical protein GCM10010300_36190 [Streptomyces olivaceoviridis]
MTAPLDALSPVRAALLRAARASADAVRDRAQADAEETLRSARATAEAVLARARDLGRADGAAEAARERVRAAQDAWAAELAARAEVYAALRTAVHAGVRRRFTEDASVGSLSAEAARKLLGPQARVTAAPAGGVTAEVPGRRVDLSADALADRALDRLGVRAETLWEPA